jgi:chaperonin GroES
MATQTLEQILQAENGNLVGVIEDVAKYGDYAVSEYEEDLSDKRYADKKRCWKEGQELVQMTESHKDFPFENASNVKYPLLTNAAVQFSSRAYPSIVQGNSVVRPKITGADPYAEQKREIEGKLEELQNAGMPKEEMQVAAQAIMQKAVELDTMIGKKTERAKNVSTFINWQLFEQFPEWEEDTDKLLIRLAAVRHHVQVQCTTHRPSAGYVLSC